MTKLQLLDDSMALVRAMTLAEIGLATFEMKREFEVGFRLHEIKGSPEIAIASLVQPMEYLRAYTATTAPGEERLILDDVVFEGDEVDFENEIYWDRAANEWLVREVVVDGAG